jgi:Zn-dependent protease with chaperone function
LINPLRRQIDERDGKIADWLASHPPIERRILLLYRMAGMPQPLVRGGKVQVLQ